MKMSSSGEIFLSFSMGTPIDAKGVQFLISAYTLIPQFRCSANYNVGKYCEVQNSLRIPSRPQTSEENEGLIGRIETIQGFPKNLVT